MREHINILLESFPDIKYDMESTISYWIITFWKTDKMFFFEIPNNDEKVIIAKINDNNVWVTIKNTNIDILISEVKQKIIN